MVKGSLVVMSSNTTVVFCWKFEAHTNKKNNKNWHEAVSDSCNRLHS